MTTASMPSVKTASRNLAEPKGVDERLSRPKASGTNDDGRGLEVVPLGIADRSNLETLFLEEVAHRPAEPLIPLPLRTCKRSASVIGAAAADPFGKGDDHAVRLRMAHAHD